MRTHVEGTLFFGAMFLILVPSYNEALSNLQLELERALMGLPPWFSGTLVRAAAGWPLTWGERAVYEALAFRAELWCAEEGVLVRDVWRLVQGLPGRMFANCSQLLLEEYGLPEIFNFTGWAEFEQERVPILSA